MTWDYAAMLPEKMNERLRTPLIYEFKRPMLLLSHYGGDIAALATSWIAVDDTKFRGEFTNQYPNILIRVTGHARTSTAGGNIAFDILIDDAYYVSSLKDTPYTSGLSFNSTPATGIDEEIDMIAVLLDVTPGKHSYSLHWKGSSGSTTLRTSTRECLMMIREL